MCYHYDEENKLVGLSYPLSETPRRMMTETGPASMTSFFRDILQGQMMLVRLPTYVNPSVLVKTRILKSLLQTLCCVLASRRELSVHLSVGPERIIDYSMLTASRSCYCAGGETALGPVYCERARLSWFREIAEQLPGMISRLEMPVIHMGVEALQERIAQLVNEWGIFFTEDQLSHLHLVFTMLTRDLGKPLVEIVYQQREDPDSSRVSGLSWSRLTEVHGFHENVIQENPLSDSICTLCTEKGLPICTCCFI